MLDGSEQIISSIPRASIALRTLAMRAAYSARVKCSVASVIPVAPLPRLLVFDFGPGSGSRRALARQCGNDGVLHPGPGQVGDGDGLRPGSPGAAPVITAPSSPNVVSADASPAAMALLSSPSVRVWLSRSGT